MSDSFNKTVLVDQPAMGTKPYKGGKTVYVDPTPSSKFESISYSVTIFDGTENFYEIDLKCFGKRKVTFGRSPENDIVLNSKLVSRQHGYFDIGKEGIRVVDQGSTNGIYINGTKKPEMNFRQGDLLRIDSSSVAKPEGVLILLSDVHSGKDWKVYSVGSAITIGREPANDIVLDHVAVSAKHASLEPSGRGIVLRDLHSTNGVFVNGERITSRELQEKDVISIQNTRLIWSAGKLYYYTYRSGFRVEAKHVMKVVKNKGKQFPICNDVSLTIEPGSLIAIIGGSGAGKSTFMNCISGYSTPSSGQVLINGEELYRNYDSLKNIIGYVPQQDIVYDNLTLKDMLDYAAKLRLPDDTTKQERDARVKDVIEMVELNGRENTLIRKLSGGQKKRASIAVELLPDPSLFFLDEPASGLDPGTERNLMKTLHKMALTGKTIVLVTHSTLNLQECDKIIFMGTGGKLCYYGSADSALEFFGVTDLVDIYNMIMEKPDYWKDKYAQKAALEASGEDGNVDSKLITKSKHHKLKQTKTLSGRYMKLVLNDKQRLLLLLLQAPFLAFLISLVKDENVYYAADATKGLLFAMACSAYWLGTLNAIQEVCKERIILRREYMTGVHLDSYIISKYITLGLIALIQTALLIAVFAVLVGCPETGVMFPPILEMFITCFLTIMSSAAIGLFVSSLFTNTDRAMTVVPLLLIPQILFASILFPLEGVTDLISYFTISRWAMEGFGTTADINGMKLILKVGEQTQEYMVKESDLFTVSNEHMFKVWLIMLFFVIVFGILSSLVLRSLKKTK